MKVIHYINLFVTVAHTLLLVASGISGLFKNEELYLYAAYSHFTFGVFQVVLSLICLFFIKKMGVDSKKYLFKYYGIVVVYFLVMYFLSKFRISNDILMILYLVIIPMVIAYYFLFTTKYIMKNFKTI